MPALFIVGGLFRASRRECDSVSEVGMDGLFGTRLRCSRRLPLGHLAYRQHLLRWLGDRHRPDLRRCSSGRFRRRHSELAQGANQNCLIALWARGPNPLNSADGGYRKWSSMFSLDDRAGNVVTTVALFLVAAAILYLARGAFLILLLSRSLCLLARTCGHVGTTAFAAGSEESHLGDCTGVLDRDTCAWQLGVRVRSAPCSANKEPECGCARNLGRSFQWKGCRRVWRAGMA